MNWLNILACPTCRVALRPQHYDAIPRETYMELFCPTCKRTYPVLLEVPQLIPQSFYSDVACITESLRYERIAMVGPENYKGLHETDPRKRAEYVAAYLLGQKDLAPILNVGPGFGYLEEQFEKDAWAGVDHYALDISRLFLDRIREEYPHAHPVFGLAEALPFRDLSIGCLVCDSAFQSINNRLKFLYEIGRVLAIGGTLVMSIAYRWDYPRKPQDGFNIDNPSELDCLELFLSDMSFELAYTWRDSETGIAVPRKEDGDYLWIMGRRTR